MEHSSAKNEARIYHVLSFYWEDFTPVLSIYDFQRDAMENVELGPGVEFSLTAGSRKFCTGRFQDGEYRPCPEKKEVTRFNQCQSCASVFIPNLECIFEPQCDGSLCDAEFCRKEHVVYLALFKDDVKVGLTGKERVMKRIIEQGADAFAVLATTSSRVSARELEKDISRRLRVSQIYRFDRFIRNLMADVSPSSMEKIYHYYAVRFEKEFQLRPGELHFLDNYPMPSSINGRIYRRSCDNGCAGEVVGVKGKCLVFRREGYTALDLSELPGHIIKGNFSKESREEEGS